MASQIEAAGKNLMLNALGVAADYAALLDGSDVEVTGGSPAYARKAVTWAAANAGSMAANGTLPVFDVPAGVTVSKVTLVTDASGATTTHATYDATNETFAGQGTYTVTAITLTI